MSFKIVSVPFDVQTRARLEDDAKSMGLSVAAFMRGLYRSYEEAKAAKAKKEAAKAKKQEGQ